MGGYRLANAGSIKREKGDTGDTSVKGETGATGVGLTIKGSYDSYEELIMEIAIWLTNLFMFGMAMLGKM